MQLHWDTKSFGAVRWNMSLHILVHFSDHTISLTSMSLITCPLWISCNIFSSILSFFLKNDSWYLTWPTYRAPPIAALFCSFLIGTSRVLKTQNAAKEKHGGLSVKSIKQNWRNRQQKTKQPTWSLEKAVSQRGALTLSREANVTREQHEKVLRWNVALCTCLVWVADFPSWSMRGFEVRKTSQILPLNAVSCAFLTVHQNEADHVLIQYFRCLLVLFQTSNVVMFSHLSGL